MISVMREYARSLKIVLLIVIVVFILTSGVLFYFGTGPFGSAGARGSAVAVVNGEEIPRERYQRAQANMMAAYERMARQRLTPELAERLGLSQQVMNELVTEAAAGERLANAQATAEKLEGSTLRIAQKAGVDGRLFGSVTNVDIVQALKAQGVEIEKAMVRMPSGPLKQVGEHPVTVALHTDVAAHITVNVVGETVGA